MKTESIRSQAFWLSVLSQDGQVTPLGDAITPVKIVGKTGNWLKVYKYTSVMYWSELCKGRWEVSLHLCPRSFHKGHSHEESMGICLCIKVLLQKSLWRTRGSSMYRGKGPPRLVRVLLPTWVEPGFASNTLGSFAIHFCRLDFKFRLRLSKKMTVSVFSISTLPHQSHPSINQ